jgi:hypothetical protein
MVLNPLYDYSFIFSYLNKNYRLDKYDDFIGLYDIRNDLRFKYGAELLLELTKVFNITKEDSKIIIDKWVKNTDNSVNLNRYWEHNQPLTTLLETINYFKEQIIVSVGIPTKYLSDNDKRFYNDRYFKNMIEN